MVNGISNSIPLYHYKKWLAFCLRCFPHIEKQYPSINLSKLLHVDKGALLLLGDFNEKVTQTWLKRRAAIRLAFLSGITCQKLPVYLLSLYHVIGHWQHTIKAHPSVLLSPV